MSEYPRHNDVPEHTKPVTLATAQDLTAAYADFGGEIDVRGYTKVGLYIDVDTNDSRSVSVNLIGLSVSGGTEYEISNNAAVEIVGAAETADKNIYVEFDVRTVPYIKVQAIAGTVGATAGDLTIQLDKKWKI